MLTILSSLLGAVEKGLDLANTKESKRHLTDLQKLRLELQEEIERPYEQQDDAKIVALIKRIEIFADTAEKIMIEAKAK